MAAIISRFNKKLLSNRVESACISLHLATAINKGKCRKSLIICKTTIKSSDVTKQYDGCCETEFKTCFCNHNKSFKFRQKCTTTELRKLSARSKTQNKTPVLIGASWPELPLTTQGLNIAISAYQRNLPFSEQTQIYFFEQKV